LLAWTGQRIGKPPGWERAVRWLAAPEKFRGGPDLCLVRDGMAFITQPSVPLGWHVAMFGTYEPGLRAILGALLGPGAVAMDVGANVGWHTLLMAKRVGDQGRVLAVEANPSVRARLADNVSINGFAHVDIVPCALAAREGQVEFYGPAEDDADSGNGHVVSEADQSREGVFTVETRTLDAVVAAAGLERLDAIKIDVEGYEWPVLQGAGTTLARFHPHVIFEYVEEYAGRGGATPDTLMDFFERQGYRLFALRRDWSERVTRGSWPECADIWAVPIQRDGEAAV
jgi:FkbM family methyltransferase